MSLYRGCQSIVYSVKWNAMMRMFKMNDTFVIMSSGYLMINLTSFIDVLEIMMSKFNARWSVINYWIHVFDKTLGCIMYICFMIMFAINLVNEFTGDYVILSFPSHSEHMKFWLWFMVYDIIPTNAEYCHVPFLNG